MQQAKHAKLYSDLPRLKSLTYPCLKDRISGSSEGFFYVSAVLNAEAPKK